MLLPWRSDKLLPLQFSDDNKVIVFVSSCEAVEFLHTLFTSVLSKQPANHQLRFLRLHGNMKQEVTPTFPASCPSVCFFILSVYFVHQERSEVFEEFSVSGSGVLLCTVSDEHLNTPAGPGGHLVQQEHLP